MINLPLNPISSGMKMPFPFDEDGILLDPYQWNRQLARDMATTDGLDQLGPNHWAILFYLREHHLTYGSLPPISQVCRTQHLDTNAVQRLFGSCREAWRIAGLPNPNVIDLTIMGRGEPPLLMKGRLAPDRSLFPTFSQREKEQTSAARLSR